MAKDNGKNKKDYRNSAIIQIKWIADDKAWTVGGTFTDDKGQKWDLGFAKTTSSALESAIQMIGGQIRPAINGKGMPQKEWDPQ